MTVDSIASSLMDIEMKRYSYSYRSTSGVTTEIAIIILACIVGGSLLVWGIKKFCRGSSSTIVHDDVVHFDNETEIRVYEVVKKEENLPAYDGEVLKSSQV
jgi:hypothetical protein